MIVQDELQTKIARFIRAKEIDEMKQRGYERMIKTLEEEVQKNVNINKCAMTDIEKLMDENAEVQKRSVPSAQQKYMPKNTGNENVADYRDRGVVLGNSLLLNRQNQQSSAKILALTKENEKLKDAVASYSANVLQEHNYA